MTELHYPDRLPAVLIGVRQLRAELAHELPWAHSVHHQHGGYACLQSELFGVVLPLSAAPGCAELLRGFDALALDAPSKTAFKAVPELAQVHLTMGQAYGVAALECLQRFLARAEFRFPTITSGTEALLEFAAASPNEFLGWPILMFEMPTSCAIEDPQARHLDVGPLDVYPARVLSRGALQRLRELVGEDLEVYLLWENSD